MSLFTLCVIIRNIFTSSEKYVHKSIAIRWVFNLFSATNPGTHFSVHELCVNVVGVTVVDITLVTPSGFPMKDKVSPRLISHF